MHVIPDMLTSDPGQKNVAVFLFCFFAVIQSFQIKRIVTSNTLQVIKLLQKNADTVMFLKFSQFIIKNPHEMHLHVFDNECINNLNEMYEF